ncbi:translation initiation factor IF-3 [Candidatus Finniella inopinata]|uniref:Translation initiation factor IF-3 n=1 Tax=Candidatus Finniella inopinata TaxID=1696036 RepID=A0A4Q7DJ78_9PROT|nr:translation initiation factor IF-3 [Candidatus Finniella inopinata]RZI46903.1 translation initiation factor IF-3 [Candidatus Finniella inopinata]
MPTDSFSSREAPKHDGPRINEEITVPQVRLVDEDGEMVGVVTRSEALQRASEIGLDLVELSPNAEPPVCKILNYGKFKYEQQKKKAEAKKKQKIIEVKEVQMRPMIDDGDLSTKCRAIQRFLEEGNKVKILMRFRGRELSHQEIGLEILLKLKQDFEEIAKTENVPKLEGRQMVMIMAPNK